MYTYPPTVALIANDYMDRLKLALRVVPSREQEEFLNEIRSHIFEAYQRTPESEGADEVARMLTVLRRIGEPADVVADRLPGTIVRSGVRHNLPMHIVGGVLIALFGIPLGVGGAAVLTGILAALAGVVVAYYAAVGAVFLAGSVFLVLGLMRTYRPEIWDRLINMGVIQLDPQFADFISQLTIAEQGSLLLLFAATLLAAGLGMFWLGRHLVRGLRLLFNLAFERVRLLARMLRRNLSTQAPAASKPVPGSGFRPSTVA